MDDATAMRRMAVLDAYEMGCREYRVTADKWLRGALWAWATYDRETEPSMHPVRPAATWAEQKARLAVAEATAGTVDPDDLMPDEILDRLTKWIITREAP